MVKKSFLVAVMVGAFLLGCTVVEVGGIEGIYFPLTDGNTWVYELTQGNQVDTVLCELNEHNPGVYTWSITHNNGDIYGMAMDGDEGSEPFEDTTKAIIDSLLSDSTMMWAGTTLPIKVSNYPISELVSVQVPAGEFNDCILVEGEPTAVGESYNFWLARDIGPVQIFAFSDNQIIRRFCLIDFRPSE